jgi:hypothetical protein
VTQKGATDTYFRSAVSFNTQAGCPLSQRQASQSWKHAEIQHSGYNSDNDSHRFGRSAGTAGASSKQPRYQSAHDDD